MYEELIAELLAQGRFAIFRTVFEIAVLTYVLYQMVRVLRGSRAVPLVFGVAILILSYYVSGVLGLPTIHSLLAALGPYLAVGLIVIFQAEIRVTLRELAHRCVPSGRAKATHYEYEDVVFAIGQLAQNRVGALIVIERESGLKTFIQSGVVLDARLSADLLVSIFQRNSPLHDGGVIIQKGRVAAAACFLPLTTNPGLVSTLGTRHRAAIGVTEESDAAALVVSETDGKISIAFGGAFERGISLDRLRLRMNQYLGAVVAPPKEASPDAWPTAVAPDEQGREKRESVKMTEIN